MRAWWGAASERLKVHLEFFFRQSSISKGEVLRPVVSPQLRENAQKQRTGLRLGAALARLQGQALTSAADCRDAPSLYPRGTGALCRRGRRAGRREDRS